MPVLICVVNDTKTYNYIQFLQFHTVSNVLLCLIVCIQSTIIMVMLYHRYMSSGNSMWCHIIYIRLQSVLTISHNEHCVVVPYHVYTIYSNNSYVVSYTYVYNQLLQLHTVSNV